MGETPNSPSIPKPSLDSRLRLRVPRGLIRMRESGIVKVSEVVSLEAKSVSFPSLSTVYTSTPTVAVGVIR